MSMNRLIGCISKCIILFLISYFYCLSDAARHTYYYWCKAYVCLSEPNLKNIAVQKVWQLFFMLVMLFVFYVG